MKGKLRYIVLGLCVVLVIGAAAIGLGIHAFKEKFSEVEFMIPDDVGITEISAMEDTREPAPDAVAATVGDVSLTNAQLQVFYWAQVAAHKQTDLEQPDFRVPLWWQKCPLAEGDVTWEKYFLDKALETWHAAQALTLQGNDEGLPEEERYKPQEDLHEKYLQDKPATAFLYGYNDAYQINTLHKNYIEQLPDLFDTVAAELGYADGEELAQQAFGTTEEALCEAAGVYNRGYSYYTALSYLIEEEEAEDDEVEEGEACVSFRQILLIPEHPKYYSKKKQQSEPQVAYGISETGKVSCVETGWVNCERKAKDMLRDFNGSFLCSEYYFGQLAFEHSADVGSQGNGGYYANMVKDQVLDDLEEWLFDPDREPGETTYIRTEYGVHLLYFSEGTTLEQKAKDDAALTEKHLDIIEAAKEKYPMTVNEEAIVMQAAAGEVTFDDFLYEDLAHERYPEVPLYFQRDYGNTMYGGYLLRTHGCGITSLAMLATYLTDTEWSPPTLCDIFGSYCGVHGTDVRLFWQAPSKLGYYFKEYVYTDDEAWQALEDGYLVVAKELAGYWTRGGHYIVLEKLTEDEQVVVRDSNIFNFGTLEGHKVDCFEWDTITPQAAVYFVFGKKPTHIAACVRCGDPDIKTVELIGDSYVCYNCDTALLRRGAYLQGTM